MSVLEEATYGFVSSYTPPEIHGGSYKLGLHSQSPPARGMLAGLKDHHQASVAQCLSEVCFYAPTDGCDAVVYQLTRPLPFENCAERDQLDQLAAAAGMECGIQFAETARPYELAAPTQGRTPAQAAQLAGTLVELPYVAGAWLVQITVLEDTLDNGGEPEVEQPDDGSDAAGGGDDRAP